MTYRRERRERREGKEFRGNGKSLSEVNGGGWRWWGSEGLTAEDAESAEKRGSSEGTARI